MYLLLFLLLAIGPATEASEPQVPIGQRDPYRAVADGWRRTNRGWENTALWNHGLVAETQSLAHHTRPYPAITACVDFVAGLHPALIAGVQLLSASYLLRGTRAPFQQNHGTRSGAPVR
ncbi:hypothetical protein Poly24_39340 [Rosistilla carotiformis]|uniref:Uncharacterized protein n=1 Tax=Rosistilla carotiformis TaxID=2528017 RepID=A0A518JXF0_9BACT|nr:hypothetical protein [Rosistilla carotiformis]QDV70215.1 hypothetical protein Poly24_39340 [Rosistilla carotiformis]